MVAWGCVSSGGSYGRIEAVIIWAANNWHHFDAWCCAKNIDPLDLPAYRYYNMALMCMKENRTDEGLELLAQSLNSCDNVRHPLKVLLGLGKSKSKITTTAQQEKTSSQEKYKYVPPWWQGDEKNAAMALSLVGTIPTQVGKAVK